MLVAQQLSMPSLSDEFRREVEAATWQGTFAKMSPDDRAAMLDIGVALRFDPDQVILEEACRIQGIYIVVRGLVRVERKDPLSRSSRDPVVLAYLGQGEAFGVMSFLEDHGSSADIIAETAVDLLYVREPDISGLILDDSGFAARFYNSLASALAARLRTISKRVQGPVDAPIAPS